MTKKRSPERTIHALGVVLTSLGERIEVLEDAIDKTADRLDESIKRELAVQKENDDLKKRLNTAQEKIARDAADLDRHTSEIARLRTELLAAKGRKTRTVAPSTGSAT